MEEETNMQDPLMEQESPEMTPLEHHETNQQTKEIHPSTKKWMWFVIIMIVVLVSFGVAWFILQENNELESELASGSKPQSEILTKRALQGIGKTLSEAKDVIKQNGDHSDKRVGRFVNQRSIYMQIENWEQYEANPLSLNDTLALENEGETREMLGPHCGSEALQAIVDFAKNSETILQWDGVNGPFILRTDTPSDTQFGNADFLAYGENCAESDIRPLYRYADQLLWIRECPSVDTTLSLEEQQDQQECIDAQEVVKDFYKRF